MTSVFSFSEDFLGEGINAVLDQIQATGADSVTLAASYHQARDVMPHNPLGSLQYLTSGSTAFQPTASRYGLLRPAARKPEEGGGLLSELVDAATTRGMSAAAWAVVLHNSRLGHAHPEVTIQNALGNHLRHVLCPAHPETRAYATALAADLVDRGVDTVRLEALSAGGFDHGETHERALIYLGESARFLLGLCFCDSCRAAGHAADIDVNALAAHVQLVLSKVLQSHTYTASLPPLSADHLCELFGDPMAAYLSSRERTVTSLAAEVTTTVRQVSASTRVVLLDPSGAALGYATGRPDTNAAAATIAWREGLDIAALSEHVDIGALCYFADPDRTLEEVKNYTSLLYPRARLEAILRPTWPDATSGPQLASNVNAAHRGGASHLNFYSYGLVRLESFEWLREVLSG